MTSFDEFDRLATVKFTEELTRDELKELMANLNEEPSNTMLVYVKNFDGTTLDIRVQSSSTVRSILVKCAERTELQDYINIAFEHKLGKPEKRVVLQPSDLRLVFGTQQLDDVQTLGFYGIPKEASLHVLLRLRGGMGKRARVDYNEVARCLKLSIQPTSMPAINTIMQEIVAAGESDEPDQAFEALVGRCPLERLQQISQGLADSKNIETKIENGYGLLVTEFADLTAQITTMEAIKNEMEKAIRFICRLSPVPPTMAH
eukprot:531682-Karenia_brevis.AAC.1